MPLLQMIEYIPSIQKADATVKQVQKKMELNESKAARLDRCVERKLRELDCQPPKKQIEVGEVQSRAEDLEQQINCLYR